MMQQCERWSNCEGNVANIEGSGARGNIATEMFNWERGARCKSEGFCAK
jgi:hypothetical protein